MPHTRSVIEALFVAVWLVVIAAEPAAAEQPSSPLADPADAFPRIVVGSAMLWGTPHSTRFRNGFYENAPLVPADTPDAGKDDRPHFPRAWFEDMRNAGIDAVDQCFFDSTPMSVLLESLDAAKASVTGIRVFPMMDNMPKKGPTFLVELWKNEALRKHPSLLRVGGRPVVITFGTHGAEVWRKRLADARKVGGSYFVIGDVSQPLWTQRHYGWPLTPELLDTVRVANEPVQGIYCFADWSPPQMRLLARLMEMGRSFTPPKLVGGCVVAGYTSSTRPGIIHDLRGTDRFRRQWLDVIAESPGFVYVTTLNDYTEATEQECSANSTYSFIDLNAYFGARWKTGQWPAVDAPQAFLSYRKAVAASEAVEVELVLLRPEMTGDEDAEQIAAQFQASLTLALNGAKRVEFAPVRPRVFPGHLVWRFWSEGGLAEDGYAVPAVEITAAGRPLPLPGGAAAPFAIVRNGEQVARRWLHVPLHRVRPGVAARLVVTGTAGNAYPRTVRVDGLPWNDVACALLEREANSLSPSITAEQLREGFREELFTGPGWCPMAYKDGTLKRNIIDQVDRYTAVIRMKDNTFVYPTPALVEPPRLVKNESSIDPATVMDVTIAPGEKLADRGWMRRDLALPGGKIRPGIQRDGNGPWFLRFDGVDDEIALGGITMPPGPATLELTLRPAQTDRHQTIFDSSEPILTLVLEPRGTLRLLRWDQEREEVMLEGRETLQPGAWHHVVAVFTGAALRLYVNGKQDGSDVPIHGLRSDHMSCVGGPARWATGIRAAGRFHGDIGSFRVLQRALTAEQVAERHRSLPRNDDGATPEPTQAERR